jgi:single-strand DNA-binding protein
MSIPTIQGIAGILTEPTLEHTPSGTAILKLFIAMNDSKFNEQSNQWETTKQFTVEAVAWEQTAERLGDQLSKGDQIYIEGRLETQSWEDKNGGGKRSKPVLNLRTARKLEKGNGGQQRQSGGFGGPSQGAQNFANQLNAQQQGGWGAPSGNPSAGWGNGDPSQPAF